MRFLLVEDDTEIQKFLSRALTEAGYQLDVASSAEEAIDLVRERTHDLFIVDLSLPGRDGLAFIEHCRGRGVFAPVLILSARRSVDERVLGLEKGGDDYLTKPFALAELLARVRVLLRRAAPAPQETTRLTIADLEIDLLSREVRRSGELIDLTTKEFALLEYLIRSRNRVVTRTMILDRVWGMRFDPATNIVDVHIHRLRSKIDSESPKKLIRTIRGVGYVVEDR
jgi:DNA-binding response OmpR family regulator